MTSSQSRKSKIIGSGSWISGGKYKDPLTYTGIEPSDHDMRLYVSEGTSKADALKEWKAAKEGIAKEIKKEFGDQADGILKSINIYPPDQLMSLCGIFQQVIKGKKTLHMLMAIAKKEESN